MSPLPKMEMMQFCMGQSKEFWMPTETVRGWYCSAVSGICRKTQHVEKGHGYRDIGMSSSAVNALKRLSSLPPWPRLLRWLLCFPPVFLHEHSPLLYHTWLLWFLSLLGVLGTYALSLEFSLVWFLYQCPLPTSPTSSILDYMTPLRLLSFILLWPVFSLYWASPNIELIVNPFRKVQPECYFLHETVPKPNSWNQLLFLPTLTQKTNAVPTLSN